MRVKVNESRCSPDSYKHVGIRWCPIDKVSNAVYNMCSTFEGRARRREQEQRYTHTVTLENTNSFKVLALTDIAVRYGILPIHSNLDGSSCCLRSPPAADD
jgi:hypothetical protein